MTTDAEFYKEMYRRECAESDRLRAECKALREANDSFAAHAIGVDRPSTITPALDAAIQDESTHTHPSDPPTQ